jgi:phosphoglucomutase
MVRKGMDGAALIKQMMVDLRENPLTEIGGEKVSLVSDYQSSIAKNLLNGEVIPIDIPKSDVLIYHTINGTKIAARPSGTEPKIKFYFSVNAPLDNIEKAAEVEKILDKKIENIINELKLN